MRKAIKNLLPHVIIFTILFVILPLILKLVVSGYIIIMNILLLLLYVIYPVVILVLGTVFGAINGFKLYYPVIALLLFILSMWILYNSSVLVHAARYAVLSLVGMLIGSLFYYISGRHKSGSNTQ